MGVPAGHLRHRLRFEAPAPLPGGDGYGNFEQGWEERCTVAAGVQPRFGGEAVIASRLTGTQPVTITVRRSSLTRDIGPGWRAVDARSGEVFAIVSPAADIDQDGAFLEMMATSGRAA